MVTDFLCPEDYMAYRKAFGSDVVGSYLGRCFEIYYYFFEFLEEQLILRHFRFGPYCMYRDIDWETLMVIIGTGKIDLSEICIESPDIYNEENSLGMVIGCIAASFGRLDIMVWLLSLPNWNGVEMDLSKILVYCFKPRITTFPSIVDLLLLDSRVDPTIDEQAAVHLASTNNRPAGLAMLLQHHWVDHTILDNLCLEVAAFKGHHLCVELLLRDNPKLYPYANN